MPIQWIKKRDDIDGNLEGVFIWEDGSWLSNGYGFNADNTPKVGRAPRLDVSQIMQMEMQIVSICMLMEDIITVHMVTTIYPVCMTVNRGTIIKYCSWRNIISS